MVKSHNFKIQQLEMYLLGICIGIETFYVPFCFVNYVVLKFKFNAFVGFENRISISIGSKLWTIMETSLTSPLPAFALCLGLNDE